MCDRREREKAGGGRKICRSEFWAFWLGVSPCCLFLYYFPFFNWTQKSEEELRQELSPCSQDPPRQTLPVQYKRVSGNEQAEKG